MNHYSLVRRTTTQLCVCFGRFFWVLPIFVVGAVLLLCGSSDATNNMMRRSGAVAFSSHIRTSRSSTVKNHVTAFSSFAMTNQHHQQQKPRRRRSGGLGLVPLAVTARANHAGGTIIRNVHPKSSTRLSASRSTTTNNELDFLEDRPCGEGDNGEEDTIFALSSGGGGATATAIAVIRLSGPSSHATLLKLMPLNRQTLPKPRRATLLNLVDPQNPKEYLDSSLVLVFRGPHSFTGEDMVELHCHGSRAVVNGILEALSSMPTLRPAERGEFTQRAFLNGKLSSLLEVEALADLIVADTSRQRTQALRQLTGQDASSQLYDAWRTDLTKALAHAEAVIDFGDNEHDDLDDVNVWGDMVPHIRALERKMSRHLHDYNRGQLVRDGLKVAIVGPPNAGKSSLLNVLAQREAAIVSPIAGTTRDIIEVVLDLGGVRCIVSDTAGMRAEGGDVIEIEGMARARKAAQDSHILLLLTDASCPTTHDDNTKTTILNDLFSDTLVPAAGIMEKNDNSYFEEDEEDEDESTGDELENDAAARSWKDQNTFFVRNKIDLINDTKMNADNKNDDGDTNGGTLEFGISCETLEGVDSLIATLERIVVERVSLGEEDETSSNTNTSVSGSASGAISSETIVITRARHRRHVKQTVLALQRFGTLSQQGPMALDLAAEELRLATSELGRITGAVDVEDVLDVLFADFCIGK
eukprot:scaffold29925_cov45-Attheya_sp.AAC.3